MSDESNPAEDSSMIATRDAAGVPVVTSSPNHIFSHGLPLTAMVEAVLYVAGEPTTIAAIASALGVPTKQVEASVANLEQSLVQRGVRLQRMGNKLQLVSAPELAEIIQKFLGLEASNRLSAAAPSPRAAP